MMADPNSTNTFRGRVVRSVGWSIVDLAGTQLFTMIITIIQARLLSPREFGLLAMITVITSFASIFAEMGFGAALVQKQDIRWEHLSSVFWLNLAIGLLLTLVFVAGAPFIAGFYSEPELTPLTMFISTNFFLGSLTIVQKNMMIKSLEFRKLSIVNIVAVAFSGGVAVVLAYFGAGVWSLAVESVLLSAVGTVLLWCLGKWRPSFIYDGAAIKDLLGFSVNLFGTKMLNYWMRNIDYLLIGRFVGPKPLGIYKNAYTIMLFPVTNVSSVLSRVMFPSFSLIQEDKARVRQIFLRATRAIALITFPMMTGLFVVVNPFVLTFFGSQWLEMIPILQVFCVAGLMQSIGTLNGNLYLSQSRADLQFRVSLFVRTNSILGIIIGLNWGALGVAVGFTIASLINSYPSFFFAGRLVGLTYWKVWNKLLSVLACALVMAAVVWGLGLLLPALWPNWSRLAVQVLAGMLVYGALIHCLQIQAYMEVQELLREQGRVLFQTAKDWLARSSNRLHDKACRQVRS